MRKSELKKFNLRSMVLHEMQKKQKVFLHLLNDSRFLNDSERLHATDGAEYYAMGRQHFLHCFVAIVFRLCGSCLHGIISSYKSLDYGETILSLSRIFSVLAMKGKFLKLQSFCISNVYLLLGKLVSRVVRKIFLLLKFLCEYCCLFVSLIRWILLYSLYMVNQTSFYFLKALRKEVLLKNWLTLPKRLNHHLLNTVHTYLSTKQV